MNSLERRISKIEATAGIADHAGMIEIRDMYSISVGYRNKVNGTNLPGPSKWAIGDWLLDGKRHYGDGLYKKASEIMGLEKNTLEQYKSLSERYKLCSRLQGLSFEHHRQTASIKKIDKPKDKDWKMSEESDTEKIQELF